MWTTPSFTITQEMAELIRLYRRRGNRALFDNVVGDVSWADLVWDYVVEKNNSGIKVGDKVRVMESAEMWQRGWNNSWEPSMDKFIGKEMMVIEDCGAAGFVLRPCDEYLIETLDDTDYEFPWFVLKKVSSVVSCPKCKIEMTDHFSAYCGSNIKKCPKCGYC